jgi:hypothetical protein
MFRPYIYYMKKNTKKSALYACHHALEYASEIDKETIIDLNKALTNILDQERRLKDEMDSDYGRRLDVLNGNIVTILYDLFKPIFANLRRSN